MASLKISLQNGEPNIFYIILLKIFSENAQQDFKNFHHQRAEGGSRIASYSKSTDQ